MHYTSKDLENICFKREFIYGYHRGQIDNILSKVREDYETLLKENDKLQSEIEIMKETVKHYKTIEESLQHTLILAQRTSENITNNAAEKANNTIREAEINAQKIINNANLKVEGIQQEFEELKKRLNVYRVKSQALLSSTMEIVKGTVTDNDD
ncbi:DivIVA domain-containing protein [Candidatus Galacturonibacter soehngenii]|uniref:DivIVA domain-containing protein n=1 Tax=Candidatus Galacturonatibacter soehngenii TaxID=2307010 RepID=A0A7V7QLF3_9FIRM|nr:DivIVA domain-containing protein [Candidatus Galacturonibacter soehngenii]KAB1439315.1 DivIVA domain-containing protein [Candidatus Galacturonibacter soehngenii]MBA4687505.1 DivIVA domain-containing protein [Candidatus Galacturonibacter soehngenii]